jgi:hypothetical protein
MASAVAVAPTQRGVHDEVHTAVVRRRRGLNLRLRGQHEGDIARGLRRESGRQPAEGRRHDPRVEALRCHEYAGGGWAELDALSYLGSDNNVPQ